MRTKAFKDWFVDWEKAARIEKLRDSKPIEITGNEIEASEDLKQYKKNALDYGKAFRGEYKNNDTGSRISVNAASIKEVLHHDVGDIAHIQSVAAIPAIVENGIYIDTVTNEDTEKNPKVREYQYYVVGLKIGDVDYTVKSVIAVDNNGNRYYDHALTKIEKGNLLNELGGITSPASQKANSLSDIKDKRLLSILQTDASKVVDENGEPLVVYHGTTSDKETRVWNEKTRDYNIEHEPFTVFKRRVGGEKNSGFFFSDNRDNAGGYGYNTYEAYLNLRNPLVIDAKGANYTDVEHDGTRRDTYGWADYAEKNGFDGVVFRNISDGVDFGALAQTNTDYVAFSPSQIKSATDNVGTFDAGNPDIRYRFAGDVFDADGQPKGEEDGLPSLKKSVPLGERKGNGHEFLESGTQGELRGRDGLPRQTAQGERERGDSAPRADARGIRSAIAGKSREEARRIAVKWAKENGLWYDYATLPFGTPFKSGNENDTYLSADGKTVYKINNLLNNGGDLAAFLDEIEDHNALFPETSYEFVGFAGFDNDNAYPIFKQKFVPGASFATETEISDYMSSIGFHPTGNDAEFANGEYTVKDLRPRNVLKDDDGRFHVVDANVERVIELGADKKTEADAKTSMAAKRAAAERLSKSLGVPVVFEERSDRPPVSERRKAKEEALGWYDTKTGEVHINLGNHADAADVERTILHETVGHMGMRRLLERNHPGAYDAFLDRVHASMPAEAQAYFLDYARKSEAGRNLPEAELNRIAADEYVAALAEVGGEPNVWQRVVAEVRGLLRRMGFGIELSEADIRALLYESRHNLESAAYYAERELMRREQKEYRDEAALSNRLDEDGREAVREDFTELTDESKAMKRTVLEQTEPIEVTTGVIKAKDGKRPIEVAIEYMRPSLPTLVKTDVGNIGIDEQSVRASLSHGFSQKKLDATTSLVEGMKRAVYLGSAKDLDGKDLDNHYFAYPINYDGERNYVFCRAREDGNTNRLYVHEVFLADELKKGVGHQTGALADASQRRGNTLYKNILSDILNAKIDNTAESSKPDGAADDVDLRFRRADASRDGRLGVISIDADRMGRYGKWTPQGMFRRASAVASYILDDSLPLRHLMTHIKRSAGGVVSDETDLWRQKTMVVSRACIIVWRYIWVI